MPAVIFGGGTRVQGHRLAAFLLRDMARFQERFMLMVDADADFSRHRHVGSIADLDHTLDDLAKQIRLPRQSRSAAASGHFRHGASEVQIDMVGHVFAACSTIAGFTPYSCSERIFSLGAKWHNRNALGLRATNARAVIISATYRPSGP